MKAKILASLIFVSASTAAMGATISANGNSARAATAPLTRVTMLPVLSGKPIGVSNSRARASSFGDAVLGKGAAENNPITGLGATGSSGSGPIGGTIRNYDADISALDVRILGLENEVSQIDVADIEQRFGDLEQDVQDLYSIGPGTGNGTSCAGNGAGTYLVNVAVGGVESCVPLSHTGSKFEE